MHPFPLSLVQDFLEGGGEGGSQLSEGVGGKEGEWLFYGEGCSFYIKNKLKSEIFNDNASFCAVLQGL